MRLADRLGHKSGEAGPAPAPPTARHDVATIAARLHGRILDRLDLTAVSQLAPDELRQRLRQIVEQLTAAERLTTSEEERNAVVESVMDELIGLGPLESVLRDPTVSDVLVNGCERVYVERGGKLMPVDVRFRDNRHLTHTIQRIVARIGRRIDESSPMVDARLPDGSRVNAVIPPLAIDGPALSIRRFGARPLSVQDLLRAGALSAEMLDYLYHAVRARRTILITGGTGAGKTTMLNALSSFIPADERIITVEDAAELRLAQPHVVRLESRPQNLEGKGEVSIRDLVRNALRMRPDRIVVGEVRGAEVLDMLQAMNTGHEGSLSTIHANNTRDAISRLTTMLGMAGTAFTEETMKTLIARAIHIVVHISRLQDGKRRVTGISEITGQMGATIQMHDVFSFERTGVAPNGAVLGQHKVQARSTLTQVFKQQEVQS
ncbi:MAG TPA: CpaF family protein [Polyangia bacterium]|nr:CpaF family protein [Polyangia bacterium]